MSERVVIVGAGLAGLACAVRLQARGFRPILLEQSDSIGGRVRTDYVEGFQLDRGFQVLLTAYPQTKSEIDHARLGLASFHSGAFVRWRGRFAVIGDPRREPGALPRTLFGPIGTIADKLRVAKLQARVSLPPLSQVLAHPEVTTAKHLLELGFSERMRNQFFRPFMGGIFLETDLATSSRKFEFVLRMFAAGTAALPQAGMGEIPAQLATKLGSDQIRLREEVVAIRPGGIQLASLEEEVKAEHIVLATDLWTANRLLGQAAPTVPAATAVCLYYAANESPVPGPWLVLNGDGFGPINNLCVPSEVQSAYAPAGNALVSVTVLNARYRDRDDLESLVRAQLFEWYGPAANEWRHLRTYRIPFAVPIQTPPALSPVDKPVRVNDGLYRCGDAEGIVSIEGAIASGCRVAEMISG